MGACRRQFAICACVVGHVPPRRLSWNCSRRNEPFWRANGQRSGGAGTLYMVRVSRSPAPAGSRQKRSRADPSARSARPFGLVEFTQHCQDGAFCNLRTAGTPKRERNAHHSFRPSACRRCQENVTPLRCIPIESNAVCGKPRNWRNHLGKSYDGCPYGEIGQWGDGSRCMWF